MKSLRLFMAICFAVASHISFAQTVLSGKIYDSSTQEPVVGASVSVVGKIVGGVTNVNGEFSFSTKEKVSEILVSCIGFQKQTIAIQTGKEISVALEPAVENLQQVVVTASREAGLRTQSPIAISKLTPKMIDEAKPTAMYEIVNKVPGVLMVNLGNEQHSMAIRQPMTTNAYFLYMEDGVPIRPMGVFNHNSILEYNQFAISSVEVVKGPVSSIYGPEAVGGAINFITHRPTAVPTAKLGIQFDQWGYRRVQYGAGATQGKFGIYIGGFFADQKNSWMAASDYDKTSFNGRVEYLLAPATRLTATYAYNNYYSQMSGSTDSIAFYNRSYVGTSDFTYRKAFSVRSRVTLDHQWKDGSTSFITAFYRNNRHGQNPAYSISWRTPSTTASGQVNSNNFSSTGIIAQHTQKINFWNSKLIVGTTLDFSPNDYWAYYVKLSAQLRADKKSVEKYTIAQERPDSLLTSYTAQIHNIGTYAQYEFEPHKNVRFSLGLRYDRMSFDYVNNLDKNAATNSGTKEYSQFTPKIGVTYDLGKGKGLYANYSKGFSPPGLTAVFRKRTVQAANGDWFYYNIEPATFDNSEIGGWASLFNNKVYVDVTYYQMIGTNELLNIRQPDNSTDYQSAGKTSHRGLEFGLTYKPSQQYFFRFGGTTSIHRFDEFILSQRASDALKNVNGMDMPSAPRWIWNTEFSYYPKAIKNLRASVEWQHVGSWYQNQVNTVSYPGYDVFNVRLGYKIFGVEVFTNILNASDALYAYNASRGNASTDRTSFTPAAPRTFTMGIQYNFGK
ncbi:MAG: TonB-dependent receptor [Spirosomataceae bacterium]